MNSTSNVARTFTVGKARVAAALACAILAALLAGALPAQAIEQEAGGSGSTRSVLTMGSLGLSTNETTIEPDYSWYVSGGGLNGTTYTIKHENTSGKTIQNKLKGLADIVNGTGNYTARTRDSFAGKTIAVEGGVATIANFLGAEWAPIGTPDRPFEGAFDGGGFQVSNFTITDTYSHAGFFGYASSLSCIKNVHITNGGIALGGPHYPDDEGYTGGYTGGKIDCVGTLVGETYGTVEGCTSTMNVTITNNTAITDNLLVICDAIGGLVGRAHGDLANSSYGGVVDIYSASDATSTREQQSYIIMTCIGGVVGFFGDLEDYDINTASISNCANTGTVRVNTAGKASDDRFSVDVVSQAGYVGGVAGYSTGSVRDSHNSGSIDTHFTMPNVIYTNGGVGYTNLSAAGSYIGGVVGCLRADVFPGFTAKVAGSYDAGTGCENTPVEVARCYNTGNVFGNHAVGGVVGLTGWYANVTACYNAIDVDADVDIPRRADYATDKEFANAYTDYVVNNTPGVKGARWNKPMVGGIVGKSYGNISYCYNRSRVWSTTDAGYYVAGIVGVMFRGTSIAGYSAPLPQTWACYNTGYAQSSLRAASIAGQNEGIIADCYAIPETAYHTTDGTELLVHSQYATVMRSEYLEVKVMKSSEAVGLLNFQAEADGWRSSFALPADGSNGGYPVLDWQPIPHTSYDLTAADKLTVTLQDDADYTGGTPHPRLEVIYTKNGESTTLYQNADFKVRVASDAIDATLMVDRTTKLETAKVARPYVATIEGIGNYTGLSSNKVNYGIVRGNLAQCTISVAEQKYNGEKRIVPAEDVTIYTPAGTVVPSEFYTYVVNDGKECINRGTYKIEATATERDDNNFVGKLVDRAFTVGPADLKDDVEVHGVTANGTTYTGTDLLTVMEFTYTGDEIHPNVTKITYNGMTLSEGTEIGSIGKDYYRGEMDPNADFTNVTGENLSFKVEAVGKSQTGNYHNYLVYTYKIVQADISKATITAPDQAYTGQPRGLVQLVYNGKTLKEGVDYTVTYTNNTNVGTATATVTGIGNFKGTAKKTFQIKNTATTTLTAAHIAAIPDQSWTGNAVTPAVTVKVGTKTLTEGVDYVVAYANNVDAGQGTVTVTGCGSYTGTPTKTFNIVAHTVSIVASGFKLPGTGNPGNLNASTTVDGVEWIKTNSVPVQSDQKGLGATVTVVSQRTDSNARNLKCNFQTIKVRNASTGADIPVEVTELKSTTTKYGANYIAVTFTMPDADVEIYKLVYTEATKDFTKCTVDPIPDQYWTGDYIEPAFTVRDANGKELVEGVDYLFHSYTNNTDLGIDKANVYLAGAGSYSGALTAHFSIVPRTLEKITVKDAVWTYDGEEHGGVVAECDPTTFLNPKVQYGYVHPSTGAIVYQSTCKKYRDVGTYTIYVLASNSYQLSERAEATITILPKEATVTADDKSKLYKLYGEDDPTLTATVEGLASRDASKGLTYSVTRDAGEDVGTYTVTPSGEENQGNYHVTYKTGTFEIRGADGLTVSADPDPVTYDGAAHGVVAKSNNIDNTTGKDKSTIRYAKNKTEADKGSYTLTTSPTFTNAGTYTVYFQAKADGYNDATGEATITIKPCDIVVTADNAVKQYGTADPPFTATVKKATGEDLPAADLAKIAYTFKRAAGEALGTYTITPAGNAVQVNKNYNVAYKSGTLTIAKNVTLTVDGTPYVGAYTGKAQTLTTDPKPSVNGAKITYATSENGTYSATKPTFTKAGTYTVYFKATLAGYNDAKGKTTVTINRAPVTVTGNSTQRFADDADPTFTATVIGLVNGEAASLIKYTVSRTDASSNTVGKHATIIPAGEKDQGNYTVTYKAGTLTIKALQTNQVSAAAVSKIYDGKAYGVTATATAKGSTIKYGTKSGTYNLGSSPTYKNAGTYTIYFQATAKNYAPATGSAKMTITPKTVTPKANDATMTYGGTPPAFTGTVDGLLGSDKATVSVTALGYTNAQLAKLNAGIYKILYPNVTSISDNYTESDDYVVGTLTVQPASIAKAALSGVSDVTYTGKAFTPAPTVKLGNTTLKANTDYTVSYQNNVNAGTATVTITGKGNYTGSASTTFTIKPASIAKATVTGVADATYTGKAITQSPTVRLGSTTLKANTDYTVSCQNNVNAGTATVTITGTGNYTGTASKTFKINPAQVSSVALSQSSATYTGKAVAKPAYTVKSGSATLKEGTDFTAKWSTTDFTNTGKKTLTVTGTGNYAGTKTATFTIAEPAKTALSKATVTLNPSAYTYDGTAKKPAVAVKVGSTTLKEGVDYTVSYKNNVAAGTATATVAAASGSRFYTGSKDATFKINAASIAKATVSGLSDATYTGKAIAPTPTVKLGSTTLKAGTDYTVSYKDNTAAGTATVTVTGKGNYTGTATKTFKINAAPNSAKPVTTAASIAKATVGGVADATYTGSAITPKPTVKLGNTTLKEGTDYTVSYKNNVKVGTATVAITGKGNYTGTVTKTFKITKADISKASVTGVSDKGFTGSAVTQKPTVKLAGKTLKEGTDYTVSYQNNVNIGTATVTIAGKGPYTGKVAKTFKITRPSQIWFRLWGSTQFDTMAKIVQEGWAAGSGGTVMLATAVNFPDALSASSVAGLFGAPVLLTNKASLPAQTRSELARIKPSRVIIAGGPGAIKTTVDAQVKAACGVAPTRCYGSTASDTAAKLATTYVKKRSDTAILATSKFFYDSLSAAPIAYAKHMPILLADSKDALSKNTLSAMKSCGIKKVIIVGGTSVIGPKIVSTLKANGISVAERLGGQTYYDTSRLIAQWALANGMSAHRMGVATSYSFYDALCGAALCGKSNSVLVLADDKNSANTAVPKANKNAIGRAYVFGGWRAVSDPVFAKFEATTK